MGSTWCVPKYKQTQQQNALFGAKAHFRRDDIHAAQKDQAFWHYPMVSTPERVHSITLHEPTMRARRSRSSSGKTRQACLEKNELYKYKFFKVVLVSSALRNLGSAASVIRWFILILNCVHVVLVAKNLAHTSAPESPMSLCSRSSEDARGSSRCRSWAAIWVHAAMMALAPSSLILLFEKRTVLRWRQLGHASATWMAVASPNLFSLSSKYCSCLQVRITLTTKDADKPVSWLLKSPRDVRPVFVTSHSTAAVRSSPRASPERRSRLRSRARPIALVSAAAEAAPHRLYRTVRSVNDAGKASRIDAMLSPSNELRCSVSPVSDDCLRAGMRVVEEQSVSETSVRLRTRTPATASKLHVMKKTLVSTAPYDTGNRRCCGRRLQTMVAIYSASFKYACPPGNGSCGCGGASTGRRSITGHRHSDHRRQTWAA
eukprot:m.446456 g.446456  ORF g.446456 m.446456 type:complete len:431 (-) comp20311_c1_seq2:409-1701(-)